MRYPVVREAGLESSPLFQAINWFLLGSPNEHAVRLQRVWVDGIIIQPRWKDLVNRRTPELARYAIFVSFTLSEISWFVVNSHVRRQP